MKKVLVVLAILLQSLMANEGFYHNRILFCLYRDQPDLSIRYLNGKPQSNLSALNQLLEKYQARVLQKWLTSADDRDVVGEINLSKVYRVEFTTTYSTAELEQIRDEFAAIPEIHSADFESINYILDTPQFDPYTPNDPRFNEQWYLKKIQTDYAWGLWAPNTPGSSDVLVGVVDTGVDYKHPELGDILYINPGEDVNGDGQITAIDSNGVDDDGNGYVDDFRGWDFAGATSGAAQDNDIRPPDAGPDHELSHGSHVSGIIAALADNSEGIAGISYRAKVIATKHSYDDDTTTPAIVNGYDGILYCAKLGAKFINCSWGGYYFLSSYEKSILDDVSDNYGAVVIGAAGNDNSDNDTAPHYPSDYSKCISVAATDNADRKASYSNYGSVIDISAPGGDGSTSSTGDLSTIHWNAGGYESWSGTSMAAPVVTAAFALLKAWFPNQSRQWYIDEILNNADPIDDLNTNYTGQLGSGRVNAYNSLARNIYPYLTVSGYELQIINDDGDGQLNPGESAKLIVTIKNDPNYLDAQNVVITASSSNGYFTFTDSVATIGTIVAGDSAANTTDDIVFQVSADAPLTPITVHILKEANQSGSNPYSHSEDIEIQPKMNQAGFPITMTTTSEALAVGDLIGDSKLETVVVSDADSLFAFDASGNKLSGFPIYLGGSVTMGPIIADMDNDGANEIVVSERTNGYLKIVEADGTFLLNMTVGEQIRDELTVADLNGDGNLEIIFGTMSKKIHAIQIDGTELSGFPQSYPSAMDKGVAVGDVDGDNQPELVFGLVNTDFYVTEVDGTVLTGFPLDLSARVSNKPVIADVQGTIYYVLTTTDRKLKVITSGGSESLNFDTVDPVNDSPTLGDINADGTLEIAFGTANTTSNYGKLYLIEFNGDTLAPFPKTLESPINTSPLFADLDNDGQLEVMVSTAGGYVHCFRYDGSYYNNFPAKFTGAQDGTGAIHDIDNDGDFEVMTGGANGINAIDIRQTKGTQGNMWQDFQANTARTNYYYYPGTSDLNEKGTELPAQFALSQNYPNPFNPTTTIKYALSEAGLVHMEIFNVLGQKVRTLIQAKQAPGTYQISWDGTDEQGKRLSSGVYIYVLRVQSSRGTTAFLQKRKMILIK